MRYNQSEFHFRICSYLLLLTLMTMSCKKEQMLEPSNQDDNYLINHDNPNDSVDHAIYQFYTSTKIPSFYKDTVALKESGGSAVNPDNYLVLSLSYSPISNDPSGNSNVNIMLPTLRDKIPLVLDILKTYVTPIIPRDIFIPSFLFVDSFWNELTPRSNLEVADGWDSFHGFNTVAIKLRRIDIMSAEEKKAYAASILAGIAFKRITSMPSQNAKLQENFYRISRDIAHPLINGDIYGVYLGFIFPADIPAPETLGFFHNIEIVFTLGGVVYPPFMFSPYEEDDLRMFLTAVFNYTTQEFNQKYYNYPAVLDKFNVIREVIREAGFQMPD